MAKLIRARAWRRLERPYTRKSKYRAKSFIKASPHSKVVKFEMGDLKNDFAYTYYLRSTADVQIRHNALESARLSALRLLEKNCGKKGFRLKIRTYPHHALRNNPLAAGAGADRMSTGMKMSFGKVVGIAARVHKEQIIMEVHVNKEFKNLGKTALNRAKHKFPITCRIETIEN